MKAATADEFAWNRLAELTDTFGQRLSGSDNLKRAIVWAADAMKRDGLENVHTERVMVPRWVRGQESIEMIEPPHHVLPMLGLGGSVGTPPAGVEADVVVVASGDELAKRSSEVKGKIVLFNVPYTNYGETVAYRSGGARMAAQYGAVASLVRSVGPMGLRTPHTGGMNYGDEPVTKIPTAAITAEDSNRIQRLVTRGVRVRLRIRMEAHFEPDVESFNVVGEIRGSEKPDEIVLVGGHFDSWDPGTGASDDGVGCVVTWEAARLMKKLNIRPKRTVRVVLFSNEENGLRGGNGYRDAHAKEAANHVFSVESDSGVFAPARLGFSGSEAARRSDRRHRHAARAARHAGDRVGWRRRRHRPDQHARQGADDGLLRRLDEVLHHSSHAGGYGRSHRTARGLACRSSAGRDDLRRGRHAAGAAEVGSHGYLTRRLVAESDRSCTAYDHRRGCVGH